MENKLTDKELTERIRNTELLLAHLEHCYRATGAKMDLSRKEADLMMKALECYKKMAQKVMDWRG